MYRFQKYLFGNSIARNQQTKVCCRRPNDTKVFHQVYSYF
jgi:hypothetical protein